MDWLSILSNDSVVRILGPELRAFFLENHHLLKSLGSSVLEDFLLLVQKGEEQEAFDRLVKATDDPQFLADMMGQIAAEQEIENASKEHVERLGQELLKILGRAAVGILLARMAV